MVILRRTEKAMVRTMCDTKLIEKNRTEDQILDVGIKGNSGSDGKDEWSEMVRHMLRRDDAHVLRKVLEFEVKGKRKRG